MREVWNDRQHASVREADRSQLLAVELGVADGDLTAVHVGAKLAPSQEAQLHQQIVHAHEILGRRDVVVDERHPVRQCECHAGRFGADREMVKEQIVGMARSHQIAIVPGQVFETRIRGLHEDVGLVAGRPQGTLDPQHLMADGVAVAERGQHLMDRRLRHDRLGPDGMRLSTFRAAGSSERRRPK